MNRLKTAFFGSLAVGLSCVGLSLGLACDAGGVDAPIEEDPGSGQEEEAAEFDPTLGNVVDGWVQPRLERLGIEPHLADQAQLIRRMSLDLNGIVPDADHFDSLANSTPAEIANFYMDRPGFVGVSQVIFSDILMYSNQEMFSRTPQIAALNDLVAQLHTDLAWDEFAKQVIMSEAYLSRFASAVDRATAAYVIFLGYDPITPYDFRFGYMFNRYELTDENNRVYTLTGNCDNDETDEVETCNAEIWGMQGSTPEDAGNMLTSLPAFAEHGAAVVWKRYIGAEVALALPELGVELGHFYADAEFDLKKLTLEVVTSLAYRQSYNYRDEDLVW